MKKKKPRDLGKIRTREHVLEDMSINHVERYIFVEGHSVERVRHDYGIDLFVTTHDGAGQIEPVRLLLQVKATDHLKILKDGRTISFVIERAHLTSWLTELSPVILIVYDGKNDRAYWLYVQAYFMSQPSFNLFSAPQQVTVRLPMSNRVTRRAVRRFRTFRERVFVQLTGKVEHDV